MQDHNNFDYQFFTWAAVLGGLISLGQILDSTEKLTFRVIAGRALVSAGLAAMAPALLAWFPDMPRVAEFAFAAVFASLGTSGLQLIIRKILTGRTT